MFFYFVLFNRLADWVLLQCHFNIMHEVVDCTERRTSKGVGGVGGKGRRVVLRLISLGVDGKLGLGWPDRTGNGVPVPGVIVSGVGTVVHITYRAVCR